MRHVCQVLVHVAGNSLGCKAAVVLQRESLCCREGLQTASSAAHDLNVGLGMVCPLALQGAAVKEAQRAACVPALPSCMLMMHTP